MVEIRTKQGATNMTINKDKMFEKCYQQGKEIKLLKSENKRKAEKIKNQYEALQRYEENQMHSNLYDSERDERNMCIADELNDTVLLLNQNGLFIESNKVIDIIKKLKGE